MKLVGLVSSYREGTLIQGAVASLARAMPNATLVYEGSAGQEVDAPETDLGGWPVPLHRGKWRTDARKRQAMLEEAKRLYPDGPLWGIILDADEILVNGEYLRDRLQWCQWEDEAHPDAQPWSRWPLRIIEGDGGMGLATGRLVRLDLIRSYDVSVSIVTNTQGIRETYGNVREDGRIWIDHFLGAVDKGMLTAWPPLPCEPHIFHRSHLRHPARRGVRMHEQEAAELTKAGLTSKP